MIRKNSGTYETTSVAGERVRAFIPSPLPPEPPNVITSEGYPLSNGLICEVHSELMSNGSRADRLPGEFRKRQTTSSGVCFRQVSYDTQRGN